MKLSDFRKAAQRLLSFPNELPFVLISERTKKELDNDGTFSDAGIQHNDILILYPLSVWEQEKKKFSPPPPEPKPEPVNDISPPPAQKLPPPPPKPARKLRLSPIILGLVGSAGAVTIFISVASNSVTRPSPEQAVKEYYSKINNGQYQIAWNALSPQFKNNKKLLPKGYSDYLKWWRGEVQRVDINQIILLSKDNTSAVTDVQLQYFMKKKQKLSPPETIRLFLVWNTQKNMWLIDATKGFD